MIRSAAGGATVGLVFFGTLHALEPRLADPDGYFHVRFASLGPAAWAGREFPWMPHSVFADGGWVDHQLLFHAALWPFTWVLPPLAAAHAGATVFAALAIGAFAAFLHRRGVASPILWTILLAGASRAFEYRMLMPRAQSLSLVWMLAGTALALEGRLARRDMWIAVVAALYAWTYHVSAALIPLVATAGLIAGRGIRPGVYALLGVGLGYAIHPQSPRTFGFLWLHAVVKVLNRPDLAVGAEWGPAPPLTWAFHVAPLALLALVALAGRARMRRARQRSTPREAPAPLGRDTVALGAIALVWVAASFLAVKWIEYAVPFGAAFLALAWRDLGWSPRIAWIGLPLALANGWQTLAHVRATMPEPDRLAAVAARLPATDCRVFHADWTDFSELFFHAPQCAYTVGLDPWFLAAADPDRHDLVEAALAGAVPEVGRLADEVFGAGWVVTTSPPMEDRAAADPRLRLVLRDGAGSLWEVNPSP